MSRIITYTFIALAVLFIAAQFIPFGEGRSNPPILAEPAWTSSETRALAKRACFDCHSNEIVWPIYSQVAPVSWLVTDHVNEGRKELNFSEWGMPNHGEGIESDEFREVITQGEMPPRSYLLMHPEARLAVAEQQQLISGLEALTR